MRTLNDTEERYLGYMKAVIRERGEDYVYDPATENPIGDNCVYISNRDSDGFVTESPVGSCLIGKMVVEHVYVDNPVDTNLARLTERTAFTPELAEVVLPPDDVENLGNRFVALLTQAQSRQDGGAEYRWVYHDFILALTGKDDTQEHFLRSYYGEPYTLTPEQEAL